MFVRNASIVLGAVVFVGNAGSLWDTWVFVEKTSKRKGAGVFVGNAGSMFGAGVVVGKPGRGWRAWVFVGNARGLWGFNPPRTEVFSRAVVFGRRLKIILVGVFVCAGDWELELLGKVSAIIKLDGVLHALRSGGVISNAVVRLVGN